VPASSAARDFGTNRQYKKSVEYDLSRFDTSEQSSVLEKRERLRVVTTTPLQRLFGSREAIVKFAACISALILMFSFSLYSRAVLATINEDINMKTEELSTLSGEYTRLQTELEGKISLKNIEEYATANLGMMKVDTTQVQYLNLDETESVTLYNTSSENSVSEQIKRAISELLSITGLNLK